MLFHDKYSNFLSEFGKGRKMVISTSENDKVSSRMMSVVQINGSFYFQTDINLRKYHQLTVNKNIALCIDNIQIEGVCKEIGNPLENSDFCAAFQEMFKGSYDAYTSLNNERLFIVNPVFIERWIYKGSIPYIEIFDIEHGKYSCEQYIGV
ncbi:pyridoxamine 5'-phosphate oxidase family protein [Ruminococcus sp.]|jgi:hypothetical protein|uniref:pyridoxamine 5'-phosphate oxidase family protein n=1 Tax=Ruminococcus sp. TaxID=41978 RepID=UPI001B740283|nr:pyridoxamine 5'-phosphate oxidase family protein [Ruminococcus sp.]MBP5431245.1 pyridoxamine 5'-phosphate oxidase family protein [Ruminococcus sp.]